MLNLQLMNKSTYKVKKNRKLEIFISALVIAGAMGISFVSSYISNLQRDNANLRIMVKQTEEYIELNRIKDIKIQELIQTLNNLESEIKNLDTIFSEVDDYKKKLDKI